MPAIDCISGESTLSEGSTSCRIGMIRDDGSFIIRELQNSFRGVTDRLRGTYDASTQGINAQRLLGTWNARSIVIPEGGLLFVSFSLKSKYMKSKTTIPFALRVSDAAPLMEIKLPVVTNKHSTLTNLPIVGRFTLATAEELREMAGRSSSLQLSSTISFIEDLEEKGLEGLWEYLTSPENSEGDTLFIISGATSRERYEIDAKFMASASKTKKTLAKKSGKSGKKTRKETAGVVFSARKRRIKLL